ncbi:MAG: hypothetical protein IJY71_02155 [Clostridia bacterium]|nr:hypothetical protein [Clostridia bacterium]
MQYPNFFLFWLLLALFSTVLLLLGAAMLPLPETALQDGLHFGRGAFLL